MAVKYFGGKYYWSSNFFRFLSTTSNMSTLNNEPKRLIKDKPDK